ncbi:MAG: DUF2304 domain-containing protein [Chloroflexi bacterium]|nr:DUF2304 domain-containing protein [Chloroflexota bacterium]
MIDRSTIFMVGASMIALLVVLELVRRRHLSEEYSLLWLGTALVMLVVGAWRDLLHSLAALVNIHHPPNLLFLLAALFLLFIQLYFSTVITRLTRESKEAAQQIALLRQELSQLRGQQMDREDDSAD